MKTATPWLLEGFTFFPSCVITLYAATKTKPIGDDDDRWFTIIVNSASTAAPIGLPPKMAEFCHTPRTEQLKKLGKVNTT
jgi:hypothetical protein